jgi:hypothetical protein
MTLNAQPDDALPLTDFINSLPKPAPWGNRPLPKIIWMFWHSGLEGAPDVVHRSLTTWQHFNPDHEVRFLTLADAEAVLGVDLEALFEKLTVDLGWAGKSDLIRVMLLAKFGGIWADATTFCLRPLSDWLHDEVRTNGFFCFRHRNKAVDREMMSWFLASISGHPLSVRTLIRSQIFLFKRRKLVVKITGHENFHRVLKIQSGERRGIDALEACERKINKTTYFWIFYIFKTVMDAHPLEASFLRTRKNRPVVQHGNLDTFLSAFVSKQTYKPVYQEIYKERVGLLFDGDAVRPDFHHKSELPHWATIRNTLAISEERKIIFVHIPKCGGTTIDHSDIFEGGIRRYGHPDLARFKEILGPRFAEFRLLALVRNPWDRLASAYHFASVHAGSYNNKDSKIAAELLDEFENELHKFLPAFCETPHRFIKALWFRPAVSFFNPSQCEIPYFIQKLEDKDNLAPLRQFLGMPDFQLGHERIGTTAPLEKSAFTDDIFRRVGEIYAADVQAFGYQDTTIAQLKY